MGREKEHCIKCGEAIRFDRVPPYCSMACEKSIEGYSEEYIRRKERLHAQIEGSTAWKGPALDPIQSIIHAAPITILSDIHAPLHSARWIERALEHARLWESKICIVNGDFIDANQISKYIGGYYRRKQLLGDDFEAGEAILKILSSEFELVYFLAGNHCIQRLNKLFGGEVAANRYWKLFGTFPNVKVTERSFVMVNDDTVVGHPRTYARGRSILPQKIAQVWQKNVVLGHGHHGGWGFSQDGRWIGVDIPCLADLEWFEYTTYEINDMPRPINGYGMIEGKYIDIFTDRTNYKRLGLAPL